MLLRIAVMLFVVLASACSPSPQGVSLPTSSSSSSAIVAAVPAVVPATGVKFIAEPASIRRCDAKDGNATVSLAWDVSAAGVEYITINIDGKVFAQGSATGSAATGEWVRDDTVFTLVDAATKKPLATLQIPYTDC